MQKAIGFLRNLFMPQENNNFRAKALHTDFLTFYLILALVFSFGFKRLALLTNVLGFATDITVDNLYQLTNTERQKNGLQTLNFSDQLSQAAANKAQDMFAKNYWAHFAPDGSSPWNFILNAGYRYQLAGENLAKNFMFSSGVVDAWMNSPTHRENMLRSDYTDVGYAIVNGNLNGQETTLVVQMFGKPLLTPVAQKNTVEKALLPEVKPVEAANSQAEAVKSQAAKQPNLPPPSTISQQTVKPKINLLRFSFNMNLVFMFFLLTALAADFYFAAKMKIIRVGGKNLAHFIFIVFILAGVILFASKGAIL